jgi:peptidoglycan/xylan/chitin deacetylase (PgdA/CDA1 family)
MMDEIKLKIALTFDDAPSINESKIKFSPERMDTVRALLIKNEVRFCTAFVIGKDAVGHEDKMERWLDAGYELANHTYYHQPSSRLTDFEFEQSVKDCHKILKSVNAFWGSKEKWFRFPFLDRGLDLMQRKRFQSILNDLGYKVSHASMSFDDHRYELAIENAVNNGNEENIKIVNNRYITNVCKTIGFIDNQCVLKYGTRIDHVAYAHFGAVSERALDQLLFKLNSSSIEWCDLSSVAASRPYRDFDSECLSNGLIYNPVESPSKIVQVRRKLARLSEKINLFQQDEYGPLWTYIQ